MASSYAVVGDGQWGKSFSDSLTSESTLSGSGEAHSHRAHNTDIGANGARRLLLLSAQVIVVVELTLFPQ